MLKELSQEMRDAVLRVAKASEEIAGATGEPVTEVLERNLIVRKPMQPERGQVIQMPREATA